MSRSSLRFDLDGISTPTRGFKGHNRTLSSDSVGRRDKGAGSGVGGVGGVGGGITSLKLKRTSTSGNSSSTPVAVNVAVRVRPHVDMVIENNQNFSLKSNESIIDSINDTEISVRTNIFGGTQNTNVSGSKKFIFDKIFDEETAQIGIFEYVGESIRKLIKGYNVSIMAYGQSGSGKSYTMGTADGQDDEDKMGIISRGSRLLFEELEGNGSDGKGFSESSGDISDISDFDFNSESRSPSRSTNSSVGVVANHSTNAPIDSPYAITVTYLEIYNEQFRDLLNPTSQKPISIREDVKGNIIVHGLKEIIVKNSSQLLQKLNQGSSIRQTNSTAINSQSSRSHAIFTIHLTQKQVNPETGIVTTITSKLNFVDLAGSERLKNTKVTETGRVKEGISINSGLTSLGKVISQLSTSGVHISYRDSKLTRVLQDSLGGKSLTYLIACITMEEGYLNETISTLSYAQRARSIQLRPEIQQVQSKEDMLMTIENLKREVEYWKSRCDGSITPGEERSLSPMRENMILGGPLIVESSVGSRLSGVSTSSSTGRSTPLSQGIPQGASSPLKQGRGSPIRGRMTPTGRTTPINKSSLITQPTGKQPSSTIPFTPITQTSTPTLLANTTPATPSTPTDQKERIQRSEEFQQNVNAVIEDYEKTITSLQESIGELKSYNIELEKEIEIKSQQLIDNEEINNDLNEYISMIENKLQTQDKLLQEYEMKLNTAINIIPTTSSPPPTPSTLIKSLQNQISSLNTQLENLRKEYNRQVNESQYITQKYNSAINKVNELTNKLHLSPPSPPSPSTSIPSSPSNSTTASTTTSPASPSPSSSSPSSPSLSSSSPLSPPPSQSPSLPRKPHHKPLKSLSFF